jgi:curved DNA-binding protein CbpA
MLRAQVSDGDDHYEALDLSAEASSEEVRDAWRFLLAAFHPDRFRDPVQRSRAEEITKRVNAAWQVLGDPALRRRYDMRRPSAPDPPPPAAAREVPCPTCASRCTAPDAGGRLTELACPGCGGAFTAMVGARCVGRPRLERRWMGLRYEAVFADDSGALSTVTFRRLPQELALSEGELFSIVFDPRRARPVYAVVHGETLDIGWRVA